MTSLLLDNSRTGAGRHRFSCKQSVFLYLISNRVTLRCTDAGFTLQINSKSCLTSPLCIYFSALTPFFGSCFTWAPFKGWGLSITKQRLQALDASFLSTLSAYFGISEIDKISESPLLRHLPEHHREYVSFSVG